MKMFNLKFKTILFIKNQRHRIFLLSIHSTFIIQRIDISVVNVIDATYNAKNAVM